ncbi:MAG: hypothetical protein ACYDCX_12645 [Acidithiobacillus sp.]
MDIHHLASATSTSVNQANTAASTSAVAVSGSVTPAATASPGEAKAVSAESLQKAIGALQDQVAQKSSIALQAGLDPNGGHPGQVLVKLLDKVTKQVFFQYYAPPEQVVKSAQSNAGAALPPGSVVSSKA